MCICVCVLSLTLCHPMYCRMGQAPRSMAFPRQEYWSGLPFPSPGDLPDSRIDPTSSALAGGFFTTEPPGKPHMYILYIINIYYTSTSWRLSTFWFSKHLIGLLTTYLLSNIPYEFCLCLTICLLVNTSMFKMTNFTYVL